jgi:hypothetical protein
MIVFHATTTTTTTEREFVFVCMYVSEPSYSPPLLDMFGNKWNIHQVVEKKSTEQKRRKNKQYRQNKLPLVYAVLLFYYIIIQH